MQSQRGQSPQRPAAAAPGQRERGDEQVSRRRARRSGIRRGPGGVRRSTEFAKAPGRLGGGAEPRNRRRRCGGRCAKIAEFVAHGAEIPHQQNRQMHDGRVTRRAVMPRPNRRMPTESGRRGHSPISAWQSKSAPSLGRELSSATAAARMCAACQRPSRGRPPGVRVLDEQFLDARQPLRRRESRQSRPLRQLTAPMVRACASTSARRFPGCARCQEHHYSPRATKEWSSSL